MLHYIDVDEYLANICVFLVTKNLGMLPLQIYMYVKKCYFEFLYNETPST